MSDRTGTGATLSIGHKGAIHVTALAAGRRSSSFAPPPRRPRVSALSDVPLGSSNALQAIHTSDPEAFFLPTDRFNERFEELNAHPDWSFHGKDFPSNRE